MSVRFQRWLCRLTASVLLLAATELSATVIKLKDGTTYSDAVIVRELDGAMHVQVPSGVIKIYYFEIDTIDGEPLQPMPAPVPLSPPSAQASTRGPQIAASVAPPTPPLPPYVHRWTMDWALLSLGAAILLWIYMLIWVQQDAAYRFEERTAVVRRWNTVVLVLPVVGFASYVLSRWVVRRRRAASAKRRFFGAHAFAPPQTPTRVLKNRSEFEFLDEDGRPVPIKKSAAEMTGIEGAREVLEQALSERASDVHIEPFEKEYRVRFRIDGLLQERMAFDKIGGTRIVSALKTLSLIDLAEKRKGQDGRFRVRSGARDIDFRASTATSIFGEKMALRILDRKGGMLGLADLGMAKELMEEFDRVIRSRSGMILATGPTGSGKTSTVYAALSRLDRKRLNVMTIEDPVEYELDGTTQLPVNPKAGVMYETGLRSILRQDPDVIFVGEMRDTEAATTAIRAALTGHLVFSSLHTKDAVNTIVRLEEMGVEKYQISSALLMVVAQRLVRVLCRECREPYPGSPTELKDLGIRLQAGQLIYHAKGCEACDGTGYQGRTGVFELLVLDEEMRRAINEAGSGQELFQIARRKGFRTCREDGADKIASGITTVDEVLQAS